MSEKYIPEPNSYDYMEGVEKSVFREDKSFQEVRANITEYFSNRRFSDEQVHKALSEVRFTDSGLQITHPFEYIKTPEEIKKIIEKTLVTKYTDLGCSSSVDGWGTLEEIAKLGFKEYVGIDLGINTESYRKKDVDVQLIKGEILAELRKMDDNSSHFGLTGLEIDNIVRGKFEPNGFVYWGTIVLSEIRRVLPEKGILYTDVGNGLFGGVLRNIDRKITDRLEDLVAEILKEFGRKSKNTNPDFVLDEFIPTEEVDKLGDYYFDVPELGFRIFIVDREQVVMTGTAYLSVILQKITFNK